jgi:hypothetical protein
MLLALIKKLLSFGFVMKHLFSTKETHLQYMQKYHLSAVKQAKKKRKNISSAKFFDRALETQRP